MAPRNIAVILTLVGAGTIWIEQGHRVVIDLPTPSELAAVAATTVTVCPEKDNVPYSVDCLAFLFGRSWQSDVPNTAPEENPPLQTGGDTLAAAPCPDRDDVPYSAACLAYLQGATALGMRWRIRVTPMWVPTIQPVPVASAR
jgi:hypothetical protein